MAARCAGSSRLTKSVPSALRATEGQPRRFDRGSAGIDASEAHSTRVPPGPSPREPPRRRNWRPWRGHLSRHPWLRPWRVCACVLRRVRLGRGLGWLGRSNRLQVLVRQHLRRLLDRLAPLLFLFGNIGQRLCCQGATNAPAVAVMSRAAATAIILVRILDNQVIGLRADSNVSPGLGSRQQALRGRGARTRRSPGTRPAA